LERRLVDMRGLSWAIPFIIFKGTTHAVKSWGPFVASIRKSED